MPSNAWNQSYDHLPRPTSESLAGPTDVCEGDLYVHVLAGERAEMSNASIWIHSGAVGLTLDAWICTLPRDEEFLRSEGLVSLPSLREVERTEITRPNSTGLFYNYVIDTGPFSRWGVGSVSFDGTQAGLAALARIAKPEPGTC